MLMAASGRVRSVRTAGSKLVFVDLEDDAGVAQVVCNFGVLQEAGLSQEQFRAFKHVIRKGDWYCTTTAIHRPCPLYVLMPFVSLRWKPPQVIRR